MPEKPWLECARMHVSPYFSFYNPPAILALSWGFPRSFPRSLSYWHFVIQRQPIAFLLHTACSLAECSDPKGIQMPATRNTGVETSSARSFWPSSRSSPVSFVLRRVAQLFWHMDFNESLHQACWKPVVFLLNS